MIRPDASRTTAPRLGEAHTWWIDRINLSAVISYHALAVLAFTGESSRNNVLVAVLMFGEGWHNNHHAAPRSAMHGHRRWELDPGFMVIRLLAALGLAWDIVMPAAYRRLESR